MTLDENSEVWEREMLCDCDTLCECALPDDAGEEVQERGRARTRAQTRAQQLHSAPNSPPAVRRIPLNGVFKHAEKVDSSVGGVFPPIAPRFKPEATRPEPATVKALAKLRELQDEAVLDAAEQWMQEMQRDREYAAAAYMALVQAAVSED